MSNKLSIKLIAIFSVLLIVVLIYGEKRWSSKINEYANSNKDEVILETIDANVKEHNPLEGKILVAFGDSVTEFGNYPDIVSSGTGMTVSNVGFGGTRVAHHTSSEYDPFSFAFLVESIVKEDFAAQQEAIEQQDNTFSPKFKNHFKNLKAINFSEVDFISVFLGTNDYMGTRDGVVPLGTELDSNRETFFGGLNIAIETLKEKYPNIQILLITPTWRMNNGKLGGGNVNTTPNAAGYFLEEYADAIIKVGENYNIPVLDLYRESGINEENQSTYLTDDVHPTDEGYKLIGGKINDFLINRY